jgi:hypothetical protein
MRDHCLVTIAATTAAATMQKGPNVNNANHASTTKPRGFPLGVRIEAKYEVPPMSAKAMPEVNATIAARFDDPDAGC